MAFRPVELTPDIEQCISCMKLRGLKSGERKKFKNFVFDKNLAPVSEHQKSHGFKSFDKKIIFEILEVGTKTTHDYESALLFKSKRG